jgi:transcriptional regulator with XRE-family HTH domain
MMSTVAKKKKNTKLAEAFGRRLRELRKSKGMSQEELGEAAGGMKVSAISRLEAGERTPSWETVLALAAALGVTPDAFTEEASEGDQPSAPPAPKKKPKKK